MSALRILSEVSGKFLKKFRIDKKNFLISKSKNSKYIAEIKEFGSKFTFAHCGNTEEENTMEGFTEYGWLHCSGIHKVRVNVKTLKIIMSEFGGYGVDSEFGNDDSAFLKIGSCSPL